MNYLEYERFSKQVVEIHETEPILAPGYGFATSAEFLPVDEFEWTIWVNDVDENKNLTSHSAIRNNPNAKRLLRENEQLKHENQLLKAQNNALSERASFIEDVVAEMATQVYQ
ncbi:hypothetical protein [Sporosarcina sp. OR05]|uniref:hypothetical protein n=1 Tax=Sporosarcina sp. OR05 TaxID=2969819 RepID=UPI003529E253